MLPIDQVPDLSTSIEDVHEERLRSMLTAVDPSVQISPTPPSRLLVDNIRQPDSETLRVESRIHSYLPYDVGTDEKTVVAILSLEQVVDVRPISATAREE